MNDIVLSSLINLFALVGVRGNVDKKKSMELVEAYLSRYFSVRNPGSYINLYSELRDFYEEFPLTDLNSVISGICSKLQSKVSEEEQGAMLLRLLEFCSIEKGSFDPFDEIFIKIAEKSGVSKEAYSDFVAFIQGKACANVLLVPYASGTVRVLNTSRNGGALIFACDGCDGVMMNDIPVYDGIFELWQQSGVLKNRHSSPLYYSTMTAKFAKIEQKSIVKLQGRNIEFRFSQGGDNGLHNFSFDLCSGQLVAIMGGSGVGKSTLLSILNGNLHPDGGSITINGHDIRESAAKALIGYVPQDDLLIEELTVRQNLRYTAKLCFEGLGEKEIDEKVMGILKDLDLAAAADLKVGSPINKFISGGQRKRLNIALELIREPAILFLDEPTSGLSSTDTEKVINLLKEQTGRGKLIIVNIHQPSSDVYKLFDRLWLLDKGGYPVFDGNPIEAVSYFKTKADYADADTSACPVCGNVNPEIVLNILDEKSLDTSGRRTDDRKTTPKAWHEMYLKSRDESSDVCVNDIPATDQKRPSRLRQMFIFLSRNFRSKISDIQYMAVTLLEAPVLALICAVLTHYTPDSGIYTIMDNKNLPSFMFMAIIVSVFLGMSGSAQEIIKDRAILKREKFLSLSYRSYIWSKMLYMAGVCLIQTGLFTLIGNAVMGVHGMLGIWWGILFVSAFLSSLIGLILSQCLSSVVAIYITIPILLIPQILLCGLVVDFDDLNPRSKQGNVPLFGDVIPSRWAFEAMSVATFRYNDYEEPVFDMEKEKFTCQYFSHEVIYEMESRLEAIEDASRSRHKNSEFDYDVIRDGLYRLGKAFPEAKAYEGEIEYDALLDYLDDLKLKLDRRSNALTLKIDRKRSEYARDNGLQTLRLLKKDNYNYQLENLVLNRAARKAFTLIDGSIVPRSGYIFLTPLSTCGRGPFYCGSKVVGSTEIPTPLFDLAIMLLMCIIASIALLADFPGRFVRKDGN